MSERSPQTDDLRARALVPADLDDETSERLRPPPSAGQARPITILQARTITGPVHLHTDPCAPSEAPTPRQLPAPRLFVDRTQARAWLDRAWAHRHGPLWVGVEGPPGIGKTALVTAWGHDHQDRWPDGTLYTDLARTSIDSTLRGWLTALGHTDLPADEDHLRALWRSATAPRQLLVVTEHATPETALALLPTGPGCAGIATAHQGLADLVATGARYVRLPALAPGAVAEIITILTGQPLPEPLLQDAVASTRGVPLAAALTAAVLARDLTPPLTEREEEEDTVPASIQTLLNALPENTVTTAAMIAAHPGPWVTTNLVAHLTESTIDQAQRVLDELVENVVVTDAGQGHYTVHDQVRAPLTHQLTPTTRTRLATGLAGFYRLRLAAAEKVLNPWRWRADDEGVELAEQSQGSEPWFTTRAQTLTWLDSELPNIVAVTGLLHELGRSDVWMICDHIGTYIVLRKPADARSLYEKGLESARAHGDGQGIGLMLQRVGTTMLRDDHELLDLYTKARDSYEQAGFTQGVASAYESIGSLLGRLGRLEEAEHAQTLSLRLHEEVGNRRGAAFQRRRLGEIHILQGNTEQAHLDFLSSYRTLMELDPPDLYQATRSTQGMITLLLQREADLPVVEMIALQALASARVSGSRVQEASLHLDLARIARAREDRAQEIDHLQRTHDLVEAGHHVAKQASALLEELEGDTP